MYNGSLKEILPKYGIEFVEFPRIEQCGEVVSASRVRKLLEIRDWESIKELVPQTTFNFLREHFI